MNRIRQLRKMKNLTQQEVAAVLGFGNTAISMYEKGLRHLDEDLIYKLCKFFGCSADYFIGLSDHMEPIISDEDAKLLKAYHAASDKERKTIAVIIRVGRLKASGVRGEHYSGYELENEVGSHIVYRAVKEENAIKRATKEFGGNWECVKIYNYK